MSDLIQQLKAEGRYRQLRPNHQEGATLTLEGGDALVNLSSNDYLGLASDPVLQAEFYRLHAANPEALRLSASSSRLLTGNFAIYEQCEVLLSNLYEAESALIFNSGYHANSGILPALATASDLILADKLVHASLIDGIRLSAAHAIRYRHNDYAQLRRLLAEKASDYRRVFVVTESIFSMDGDRADLLQLVALKREFPNVVLYIDEAHAVGCCGPTGLGCCEEEGVIEQVDLLVGTFGKALAGVGAYVISSNALRELMVNTVRTLIFSTALPPVSLHWSYFILERLASFEPRRVRLRHIVERLTAHPRFADTRSRSHILPVMIGDSAEALRRSQQLQALGFYALAVRPPTVPLGTARLRLSLRADLTDLQIDQFLHHI